MLEPTARDYNNLPQFGSRVNCPMFDGSTKSHFLTMQGSINFFQWRIKRPSKTGNCTIRVSMDGTNFIPLRPEGVSSQRFPCGRKYGYESGKFKLPRSIVASNPGAVLQMEFDTEFGTIVQCSDIIVQK